MAKKKGKRVDIDKKLALAAKKEAKAEKAAQKRLAKASRIAGEASDNDDNSVSNEHNNEDDLDQLLLQYKQQDVLLAAGTAAVIQDCAAPPLARANATFTLTTDTKKSNASAYLFGGEYFDGVQTVASNQLFRYDVGTNVWKQILTAASQLVPPPRCAHSTVYYNKCLYVFGGELASVGSTTFHHYRDLYKLDTTTLVWTELNRSASAKATTVCSPSARSGHAACVYKHFMVIFGGFCDGSSDQAVPRWFNDVYVLNLQTEQWMDVPHSKLTVRPEPRSACTAALVDDDRWLLHGGVSKRLQSRQATPSSSIDPQEGLNHLQQRPPPDTKIHTDAWILHLRALTKGQPPTWERWTSSLTTAVEREAATLGSHNGRSGVGSVSYQNNVILYGGVVDQEMHHHKMESVFYNDLSMFVVSKRKFVPIRVNISPTNTAAGVVTAIEEDDNYVNENILVANGDDGDKTDKTGWDLDRLRSSMFAFKDGEGRTVYERLERCRGEESDEEKEDEFDEQEKVADECPKKTKGNQKHELVADVIVDRTEPLPRIKSRLFIHGHNLYMYGGLTEVGDREVTLDDMWRIDLKKKRHWECLDRGKMHMQVWKGAMHDDDESYVSNADQDGVSSAVGDDADNFDGDHLTDSESEGNQATVNEERKSSKRLKQEMKHLIDVYQLENEEKTPMPGEVLTDFHARTAEYWQKQVGESASNEATSQTVSDKESKREGFVLARARFDLVDPIIERLFNIKLEQKERKKQKDRKPKKSKKAER